MAAVRRRLIDALTLLSLLIAASVWLFVMIDRVVYFGPRNRYCVFYDGLYINLARTDGVSGVNVSVPVLLTIAVCLCLPVLHLRRWLKRRASEKEKNNADLCRVCGYDLRATPDRCPECGTPAPQGAAG